ncbi:MAG: DUF5335 domain-containing protein [Myxococcaceae bacterium]|nr:DUF5335 domain-containing protein [Myxococcaceae bacterium]MCI0670208.1 DUF5335 domain-containing protein [Myxococcaceae bacterium]
MQTREIPQNQWSDFLYTVAEQHRDARVRVEVDGKDIGEQPLGEDLALVDIELEKKGSAKGDISLTFGTKGGGEMEHRILMPDHVYAEETDSGELAVLDIEDRGKHKTLVTFELSPQSQAP